MNDSHTRELGEIKIGPQSRATLAALRPQGIRTFPAGSQSVLEDLVCDSPGAVALLDESFLHIEASDEYCARLQLTKVEIIGKPLGQLSEGLNDALNQVVARAAMGESVTLQETLDSTSKVKSSCTIWKLHPWRKSRRAIGGFVLFVNDVAEHAPAEDPQDVGIASQGTGEAPLGVAEQSQSAQKESIRRAVDETAHDFNNALTAISGYSSLLMEELGSDPKLGKRIVSIHNAGERAVKLAARLVALSLTAHEAAP